MGRELDDITIAIDTTRAGRGAIARRALGALALAVACAGAPGCSDGPLLAPPEAGREAGAAATFEVHETGALVSIYAEASTWARVRVESAPGEVVAEVGPVALDATRGRTGVAELAGLAPGTAYQYVVELEHGSVVGPYRFRTAPAPDADAALHFVWSADVDLSSEFESPIFASMSDSGADFFVSLGDWPYADNPPAAYTVEEYRDRHRRVRAADKVQDMLRALPVYAIYDDHEARNNWDGRFRVEEAERIANAVTAWDEWFPLQATRSGESRHYRAWRWGRHAELFMLDTRCCRSANKDLDGPAKTMLGAEQKQWLVEALRASQATFKIVFTSVALIGNSPDDWSAFVYERDQLLGELAAAGISGLMALTGDGHIFSATVLPAWGLREFMAGPLARHPRDLDPPDPTILAQYKGFNYGEVRVILDPPGPPTLEIVCRDAQGNARFRDVFRASALTLTAP
jgi:alkaline phosphatase D